MSAATVWLVTTGSGEDGDEWHVLGVFSSPEKAAAYKEGYERPRLTTRGSYYSLTARVEEWPVDPAYEPNPWQQR